MKCENCGKNEVTFIYRSNINGKIEEKHLCGRCAEQLGLTRQMAASSRSMMQGFFGNSFFDDFFAPSLFGRMNRMLEDPFDDFFAEMPALGAPASRQETRQETSQDTLVDQEEQKRISRRRQLNALRMEMKRAVQQENFERAAELRDEIHKLEADS